MEQSYHIFPIFTRLLKNNNINIERDSFNMVLLKKEYIFDEESTTYNDIKSYEIESDGYTKGGKKVYIQKLLNNSSKSNYYDISSNNKMNTPITWKGITAEIGGVIVYNDTLDNKPLSIYFNFEESITLEDGEDLTISWGDSYAFAIYKEFIPSTATPKYLDDVTLNFVSAVEGTEVKVKFDFTGKVDSEYTLLRISDTLEELLSCTEENISDAYENRVPSIKAVRNAVQSAIDASINGAVIKIGNTTDHIFSDLVGLQEIEAVSIRLKELNVQESAVIKVLNVSSIESDALISHKISAEEINTNIVKVFDDIQFSKPIQIKISDGDEVVYSAMVSNTNTEIVIERKSISSEDIQEIFTGFDNSFTPKKEYTVVTSITDSSTDNQIPTAKAIYEKFKGNIYTRGGYVVYEE